MHGLHHLRKRMLAAQGLEPFPARTSLTRILDSVMYIVGFLAPFALLPQILQIYGTRSSAGVSLLTWSLVTLVNTLWTMYAWVHKDKQLFFASGLLIIFNLVIVIGLLLY